jgi:sec-independent protein translocase protein TatA
MGFGSLWHWIIVLLVVLVLFGRGRVSEIMGDFGKGIKSFKQGLNEDEQKPATAPPAAVQIPSATVTTTPVPAAPAADVAPTAPASETTGTGNS